MITENFLNKLLTDNSFRATINGQECQLLIKDTLRTVKGEGVFIDAICIEDSEGISDQEFLRNSVQTPVNIGQINFLNDPADNRTIRAWLIQKAHQPQPAKTSRGSKWSFQNVITAGSFQLSLN